ncbi:hypothetical protein CRG98_025717 [Punica granatum]|uniref:Uncharacterized protein n=1 Tax=Punica granatum TaxID=22663 RepID=A0A2I0JD38_PUNGR|nr:hypothetical protein CRG98_025717 [Punica granatum]
MLSAPIKASPSAAALACASDSCRAHRAPPQAPSESLASPLSVSSTSSPWWLSSPSLSSSTSLRVGAMTEESWVVIVVSVPQICDRDDVDGASEVTGASSSSPSSIFSESQVRWKSPIPFGGHSLSHSDLSVVVNGGCSPCHAG